jgi:hypothetical protein
MSAEAVPGMAAMSNVNVSPTSNGTPLGCPETFAGSGVARHKLWSPSLAMRRAFAAMMVVPFFLHIAVGVAGCRRWC